MIEVILYTTEGCHLCEQAIELINSLGQSINVSSVEIGDVDSLVERYGMTIPVVELPSGEQLNWPFSKQQLIDAL